MLFFRKLFDHWKAFSRLVTKINTYLLLGIVYIVVITPVGLVIRIAGRSIFRAQTKETLWERASLSDDMEKQF